MAKNIAIVLNNGSLNSAVVAALASQSHRTIMLYAQTTPAPLPRSRAAFDQQVAHFKPYREHALAIPYWSPLGAASAAYSADPRQPGSLAPKLVELLPLIAVALRLAAHYQAAALYLGLRVGNNADELAAATEYLQILDELVQLPCRQTDLHVLAPLLELEPWQVVDLGYQVNAPFDKTWSCLDQAPEPCWACAACHTRDDAFQHAAKTGPSKIARNG